MNTGLTSVTFRKKHVAEIIECAHKSGLSGIEWGGDIHVPPHDIAKAKRVREKTEQAGLKVLSYGSYYKAGPEEDFAPVLDTACALNAPIIRVWAGRKRPHEITDDVFAQLVLKLQNDCIAAHEKEIAVALEYHRGTMTETADGALKLLRAVNHPALKTYWQPNPEISNATHLKEIECLAPWIVTYHVFHWLPDGTRRLLGEGKDIWATYCMKAKECGIAPNLILEFVKDNDDACFVKDAQTLNELYTRFFKL